MLTFAPGILNLPSKDSFHQTWCWAERIFGDYNYKSHNQDSFVNGSKNIWKQKSRLDTAFFSPFFLLSFFSPGTQFISLLHFYSCLENNRWNILLSVWKGRKTAGKGAGEAVIPSASPGDWLTVQSSIFSGDMLVWKGPKMWLRGIQSRCQGRSVASTPTKTPALWRTSWHTTPCEPSNDKCFGSASQYPVSEVTRGHFPQVWGQSHFFFFPLVPQKV